jgi:hypothetical protein
VCQVLEWEHDVDQCTHGDAGKNNIPWAKARHKAWKITYCTMPLMHPYTDTHKPMDAGLRPSPPSSTDVDQTNGISAIDALVRSASIA